MVGLMAVTSFTGYEPSPVSAATATETETVSISILFPDTVKEGEKHLEPKTYDEIKDMILYHDDEYKHRTGWNAALFECVEDNTENIIDPKEMPEVLMDTSSIEKPVKKVIKPKDMPVVSMGNSSIAKPNAALTTVLEFSPAVKGEATWFFEGKTDVMDTKTGKKIGDGFKYKSLNGQYITAIKPGRTQDFATAVNGDPSKVNTETENKRFDVIPLKQNPDDASETAKTPFNMVLLDDILDSSGAQYTTSGGAYQVTRVDRVEETPPTVLEFDPAVKGETTWFYENMTDVMDAESGKRIGNGYKYRSLGGQYITTIQPGKTQDFAEAVNGDPSKVNTETKNKRFNVIPLKNNPDDLEEVAKTPFNRVLIEDILASSGAEYTTSGGAYHVTKVARDESIENNKWVKQEDMEHHTVDSHDPHDVDKFKDEIIKMFNDAEYAIEGKTGQEIYDAAVLSGEQFKYDEVRRVPDHIIAAGIPKHNTEYGRYRIYEDSTVKRRKPPETACDLDDVGFTYENNDFYVSMEFDIEIDKEEDDEICVPESWHIISGGGSDDGNRTQKKVECIVDPGTTKGETGGYVSWKLYKDIPDTDSLSEIENSLERAGIHRKKRDEVWTTRAPGIVPGKSTVRHRVPEVQLESITYPSRDEVTPTPPPYRDVYSDGIKDINIVYQHEYWYTNYKKVTWYRDDSRSWKSETCDEDGSCSGGYWRSWKNGTPYIVKDLPDWSKKEYHTHTETLLANHSRGQESDLGDNEEEIKLVIGKEKYVGEDEEVFYEIFKVAKRAMKNFKTQGAMKIMEAPINYTSEFENSNYHTYTEAFYCAHDLDKNLQVKYSSAENFCGAYAIPLELVSGDSPDMMFESVDDFHITKNTGFVFSVGEDENIEEEVATQYMEATGGAEYEDEVLDLDDKYKSSYFLPIDGNSDMKVEEVYTNKVRVGRFGLSDYTIGFDQKYSFKTYLLGSVFENKGSDVWIVEQHEPTLKVAYPFSKTLTQVGGAGVKESAGRRTDLLHGYRVTDGKGFQRAVK